MFGGKAIIVIGASQVGKSCSRLIYGSYPDIINHTDDAKVFLHNLSNSYLYKDLLSLESIRRPALLGKLLTALALFFVAEYLFFQLIG